MPPKVRPTCELLKDSLATKNGLSYDREDCSDPAAGLGNRNARCSPLTGSRYGRLLNSGGVRQAPRRSPSVLLRLVMKPPSPSTYAMLAPTFKLSNTRWEP